MAFFDTLAPVFARESPRTVRVARMVAEAATFSPTDVVLDLGGGAGTIAGLLASKVASIMVVDPSHKMIYQCRKKGITCLLGTGEDIPLADESVDKIVVVDAFHHMPAQAEAVHEIRRVLKPGGQVVVVEINPDTWGGALLSFIEWLLNLGSIFYVPLMLSSLFAMGGFRTEVPRNATVQYVLVATKR